MAKYPFLSDQWMEEVQKIREQYRGKTQKVPHVVRMNQVVTDAPFGDGTVKISMDTSSGDAEVEFGHLDAPDLTVTLDYATAKAIMVEGSPQAGMQAFMAGKVKVDGDMSKLMALQGTPPDPVAAEIADKVKDITEE